MPKGTVICYLFSLIFYGMGYSKMLDIENAATVTGHENYVFLATLYFVLTIFFAAIGSFFLYLNYLKNHEIEIVVCHQNSKFRLIDLFPRHINHLPPSIQHKKYC